MSWSLDCGRWKREFQTERAYPSSFKRKNMRNTLLTLFRLSVTAFSVFMAAESIAQSTKIGVQGIIRKSDGKSVDDGTYAITFRLYNSLTGGTALWSEVQSDVEISGGIYNVLIGSVNNLNLPFTEDYYLSVQVEDAPEITPRQQLTTAPYALALNGSGNLFTSSGAVGVGTNSPASGYMLHVKNSSGPADQLIEGSTGSSIVIRNASSSVSIGLDNSNNNLKINPGSNNTVFQIGGSNKLEINNNGINLTGIGTFSNGVNVTSGTVSMGNFSIAGSAVNNPNNTDFKYGGSTKLSVTTEGLAVAGHLVASGSKDYTSAFSYYNSSTSGCQSNTGFSSAYSISCSNGIRGPEFNAYSDRRIKKDITSSDTKSDLEILRKLRVSDYRHRDDQSNGPGYKKGFIAQQVKEVFPESVSVTKGFIPDICQNAADVKLAGKQLLVRTTQPHGLNPGDTVRLYFGDKLQDFPVTAAPATDVFVISGWQEALPDQLFVYGKQVNDFHQVDYDRIHTLNVSVTQELLRRKDALEREKAALKKDNESLKASLDALDVRMRRLETTFSH